MITLLVILLAFMIIGSIIAIETRDLLSSVISVGAVGMGLSVVFLLLGAPDLAIVQVAVEVLSLIMLLRVIVIREDVTVAHRFRHEDVFATSSALVFFGIFLVFAWMTFQKLPAFGQPLLAVSGNYLAHGLSDVNSPNIVTAILLDYRAYDTLGEATVIFTAIIGALAILRSTGRISDERHDPDR
ncbi:MAG TPA: hydrogen gas-evolving membrane-bound hydrogenase subunit E [Planctomycetota bacterium]|nr:hydrogen gas-evolving membrane-bound hydrogenase subunit E [Planctomycetota bacterium]